MLSTGAIDCSMKCGTGLDDSARCKPTMQDLRRLPDHRPQSCRLTWSMVRMSSLSVRMNDAIEIFPHELTQVVEPCSPQTLSF
jgi:hypothetical protein